MSFNPIRENKILAKISGFTVYESCKYKRPNNQSTDQTARMLRMIVAFACLFVLMLYVPANTFSVMPGRIPVFLCWSSTRQQIKCLAQGYNTATPPMFSLKLYPSIPSLTFSHGSLIYVCGSTNWATVLRFCAFGVRTQYIQIFRIEFNKICR